MKVGTPLALSLTLFSMSACTDASSLFSPAPDIAGSLVAPMCFGKSATIYPGSPGVGTIVDGGGGTNVITGTAGNDVIVGGVLVDSIYGLGGNDRICAGAGDDFIDGGSGTNLVDGDAGRDYASYLTASEGVKVILITGKARNTLITETLRNIESINGSLFDDDIRGNADTNVLRGNAGADRLTGGEGADSLDGGAGEDRINYNASLGAVVVDLANNTGHGGDAAGDTYASVEVVVGSAMADSLLGDDQSNELHGRGGNDYLSGAMGRDKLIGGDGDDVLHGGDGSDTLIPGSGANLLDGGLGNDRVVGATCLDTVSNAENVQSESCTVEAPVAIDEGVAGGSAPGATFHTALNALQTTSVNLLANDDRGFPIASITHFGEIRTNDRAGTLAPASGSVTDHAAGDSVAVGANGYLIVNADGTYQFQPPTNYTGLFEFKYRITNTSSFDDATVTLAVGVRPSAANSTYAETLIGNVPIYTTTSSNTVVDAAGDVPAFALAEAVGGNVGLALNKTFTFVPQLGFTGAASFTYTLTNGFGTSAPATVSFTVGTPVWFVDASAAAGGDGRKETPFNCLVGPGCFNLSANNAGDVIHVASGSYLNADALRLKANQRLIGQGSAVSFEEASGLSWPADAGSVPATGGTAPTLSSSTDTVVVLGSMNHLRGVRIGATSGLALFGSAFDTVFVATDVAISNANGAALSLSTGAIVGDFGAVESTTSSGSAVVLANIDGSISLSGPFLGNDGAAALVVIDGGSVNVTTTGNVTQNGNAALLSVSNGHSGTLTFNTGTLTASNGSGLQFDNADGTYTFTGTVNLSNTASEADAGIDVVNGSGGTFSFASTSAITNPVRDAIHVLNSAPAFTYDGAITKTNGSTGIDIEGNTGGTISINSVAGTVRTINTLALNIGIIVISNTGATINFAGGNLAVTSDDGNAFEVTRGGTVNVTGPANTIASTGGIALLVDNTNIGADGMTFRSISADGGRNGIRLVHPGAGKLTIEGDGGVCTIATPTCSGGTIRNTWNEGVYLIDVSGLRLNLLRVLDTGGHGIFGITASGVTIANSLIQGAGDQTGESGIDFAWPGAVANLTGTDSIIGTVIAGSSSGAVRIRNRGLSTLDLVVQGSTFSGAGGQFQLTAEASATITARINGNAFNQVSNDAFAGYAESIHSSTGGGTLNITFENNTISGTLGGSSDNGIALQATQFSGIRYMIQGNNVQNQRNQAIMVRSNNNANVQGTIQNNTIGSTTSRSASYWAQGILVNVEENATSIARIHNNTVGSTYLQGIFANISGPTSANLPNGQIWITSNSTRTPVSSSGYLPSIDVIMDGAKGCAKIENNAAQLGNGTAGSIDVWNNGSAFDIDGLGSDAATYLRIKNPASAAPILASGTFGFGLCLPPAATPTPL